MLLVCYVVAKALGLGILSELFLPAYALAILLWSRRLADETRDNRFVSFASWMLLASLFVAGISLFTVLYITTLVEQLGLEAAPLAMAITVQLLFPSILCILGQLAVAVLNLMYMIWVWRYTGLTLFLAAGVLFLLAIFAMHTPLGKPLLLCSGLSLAAASYMLRS